MQEDGRIVKAERGRVRGRSQMEAQTPHPARARYRSALATLSHKGRGKASKRCARALSYAAAFSLSLMSVNTRPGARSRV